MKVKLTESRATEQDGRVVSQNPGDVIEVSSEEAKALLERGSAEPVGRKRVDQAEKR